MTEHVLIAIAWPYANAEIHVGNITGSHLPGDIVARYHRLKGNKVLMISGTDAHGTPVTLAADKEGIPVEEIYKKYHKSFLSLFQELGIQYDLYTSTHTENHFKIAQTIFTALRLNGFLFTKRSMQWYSVSSTKFLPDRYVEGICYLCGYNNARSDQCDSCGNVLEPEKLIDPRAKTGDGALELRETEHFYLDLSKLEPEVKKFLKERANHMREQVLGESLGKIEAEGLKPRPITRDLDWGIPVPVNDWEGKCLYVWFEAVIGYLSASVEWSKLGPHMDAWKNWWVNSEARTYYFIGKDNIFFHTTFWPAQLMGAGKEFLHLFDEEEGVLTLPFDVPANQFMNLEGEKISGSRNWAVWGRDALTRYDPDALRYYLTVNMPENHDSDWDWEEFVAKNNGELVATWGNLVNRVLSFCYKNWEGFVPTFTKNNEPIDPPLRAADRELISMIEDGFNSVGNMLEKIKLRSALQEAFRLATSVNQYLDTMSPWQEIKKDKESAALTIYTALRAIDSLKILFSPFLPFTCEQLHGFFGYEDSLFGSSSVETVKDSLGEHSILKHSPIAENQWRPSELKTCTKLVNPVPLFKKLDEVVIEEERARLGK